MGSRIIIAAAAVAAAFTFIGAGPGERSGTPVAEDPVWRDQVLDPRTPAVAPVAVHVEAGAVADADGFVHGRAVTLSEGTRVVLDLGVNTGGRVEVDVVSGAGATVRLTYAEARRFLTPVGDTRGESLGSDDDPDARFDTFTATDGLRWRSPAVRGGQRWIAVTNEGPGPVTLAAVRVVVGHLRAAPDDYRGRFLSSDPVLNGAWYASAYTYDAAVAGDPLVLMDGAKRDRLVFSGDLAIGQLVGLHTVAQGPAISRDSLWLFSCQQAPDGFIPGYSAIDVRCPATPPAPTTPVPPLRSGEYVAWYVAAAAEYDRLTGDHATVRRLLPVLRRAAGYLLDNRQDGLYTRTQDQGFEYNWRANANFGASAYTNVVVWRALRGLADLERRVGAGRTAAARYEREAATLRTALLKRLWDPQAGALRVNTLDPLPNHPQDANVQAVASGLLTGERARQAMRFVDRALQTPLGAKNSELDGDSFVTQYISPFTSSWELLARLRTGDTDGALRLIRRLWGHMLASDPGSTVWEKVGLDGEPQPNDGGRGGSDTTRPEGAGYVSLAHAWSGGPVPALSGYVLGARATAPGYERWVVAPQPGDLQWAQGQVPTPRGPIVSRWTRAGGGFTLTVSAPRGTRGTVVLPNAAKRPVYRDGKRAGTGTRFAVRGGATVTFAL